MNIAIDSDTYLDREPGALSPGNFGGNHSSDTTRKVGELQSTMKLLELPADIINILPHYLDSIHDLYSILLTCRTLYSAYRNTEIRLPPILPKPDGQPLFQPYPHLLLASLARQIGDWAISSSSNRYELYQVLINGYDGLLSLAERVTLVSLSDLRHLHATKYSLLNPLTRLVDFEVGPAMVRNQDMDPAEYGLTICLCPDIAVMNYIVYCELFHHYIDDILASSEEPSTHNTRATQRENLDRNKTELANVAQSLTVRDGTIPLPMPLEAGIRQRFIAYCLPDLNNRRNHDCESLGRNDEQQLLDYVEMSYSQAVRRRDDALTRYWQTGVLQDIPEDEYVELRRHEADWRPATADKRMALFLTVAGHLGWLSLQMLLLDGLASSEVKKKLGDIRAKVQAIPKGLVDRWEFWDEPGSLVSPDSQRYAAYWSEWLGLASDCHEGMSTYTKPEEEIRAEEEACENLLKLKLPAEQLGVANPVAACS